MLKTLPPVASAYQFTASPSVAVAAKVTVPVPQRPAGVEPVINGLETLIVTVLELTVSELLAQVTAQ